MYPIGMGVTNDGENLRSQTIIRIDWSEGGGGGQTSVCQSYVARQGARGLHLLDVVL